MGNALCISFRKGRVALRRSDSSGRPIEGSPLESCPNPVLSNSPWRPANVCRKPRECSLGTLQDICVGAVAKHATLLGPKVGLLPTDLLQRVVDQLLQDGSFSLELLAKLGASPSLGDIQLDLDTLCLAGVSGVNDCTVRVLERCPRLRILDLSGCCQLTDAGLAPLKRHNAHMQRLTVAHCAQLTDASLTHLSGMSKLVSLDLSGCEGLSGRGLINLAGLTALTRLDLSTCGGLKGGLQHIAGLHRLQQLELGWCGTSGPINGGPQGVSGGGGGGLRDIEVQWLSDLTALTRLSLCCSQVTDSGLACLPGRLRHLRELDLRGCTAVNDAAMTAVGRLTELTMLLLDNCSNVGDAGLLALAPLVKLKELGLAHTAVRADGLAALAAAGPAMAASLTSLDLDSCAGVTNRRGAQALKMYPNLERLVLADTGVGDAVVSALAASTTLPRCLKYLDLSYSKVTDLGAPSLGRLTSLQHLNIDTTGVSDAALPHLLPLAPSLTSLDLFGARITDAGAVLLSSLTRLQHLQLCGGSLGDAGCAALARLTALTCLDLSQNARITDAGIAALLAGVANPSPGNGGASPASSSAPSGSSSPSLSPSPSHGPGVGAGAGGAENAAAAAGGQGAVQLAAMHILVHPAGFQAALAQNQANHLQHQAALHHNNHNNDRRRNSSGSSSSSSGSDNGNGSDTGGTLSTTSSGSSSSGSSGRSSSGASSTASGESASSRSSMCKLQALALNQTGITGSSLAAVSALPGLESLSLCCTRVPESAVSALRAARPTLVVKYSRKPPPALPRVAI